MTRFAWVYWRRDLRAMLAVFTGSTVRFTGLAIGKYGIGIIHKEPRLTEWEETE